MPPGAGIGRVSTLPADTQGFDLWGTPDGYVFLNNNAPGGPQVRYHRFSGGPAPEAYLAWSGAPGEYWRIVWVTPLSGGEGLAPFPPIAPAPADPTLLITPPPGALPIIPALPGFSLTPAPTLPPPAVITPTLAVGGRARIHTTEGDRLRIRSGPGTSYAVLFQLPDGTPVTLLEGPIPGGDYKWWRIQTDDGRSGWAVEGVTDDGAYLQTLVPLP